MKILVDYEALSGNAAAAMRRVTTLFSRAGAPVVEVVCDGKTKRTASTSYREVALSFADSQQLTLRIKATGDVYQVLLNGKPIPVKEQDDPDKAVGELAGLLDGNRKKFQKRMAALTMKPPEGAKSAAPKLRDVLSKQIAAVDAEINSATEELAALQSE